MTFGLFYLFIVIPSILEVRPQSHHNPHYYHGLSPADRNHHNLEHGTLSHGTLSHGTTIPISDQRSLSTEVKTNYGLPTPTSTMGSVDSTRIMFPQQFDPSLRPLTSSFNSTFINSSLSSNHKPKKIPLKILRSLSTEKDIVRIFEKYVTNVQFKTVNGLKYVVDIQGEPIDTGLEGPIIIETNKPDKDKPKIFGGFSNRNALTTALKSQERLGVSSQVSKPAICEPELQTVEIPASNDPSIIQFPKCVRLERCGGCCVSDLLTCEPIRSKQTEIQVRKLVYNDETQKFEYRNTEVVILPSHVACHCNCRIKSSDCSPQQVYSSEDCQCKCKNYGEQDSCTGKQDRLWDPVLCQCGCREVKICASGHIFDMESCDCIPNPDHARRSSSHSNRRERRASTNSRLRLLR